MKAPPLAILGTGLVTAVGSSAAACCAAFRAGVTNPTETRFVDASGAWIRAHAVDALRPPASGLDKLARMSALAIEESLQGLARAHWHRLPVWLCMAEPDRPGRTPGLDTALWPRIEKALRVRFDAAPTLVAQGRVAAAAALADVRARLPDLAVPAALVVAADSLLSAATVGAYERAQRLLTDVNADGFMPGEGAGALCVGRLPAGATGLCVAGIGLGHERAPLDGAEPLRADGLTQAIRAGLEDARCRMEDIDLRITDHAGERYYFREAALALTRTLRAAKDEPFDWWHPAECTGEIGAAAGIAVIATAQHACRGGYAPGPRVLAHWSADDGRRAAIVLEHRSPAA